MFDSSLKDAFNLRPAEYSILAHKVSYKYIVEVILRSVNFLKSGYIDVNCFKNIMTELLYLVYGDDSYRSNNVHDNECFNQVVVKINELYDSLKNITTCQFKCVSLINQIIYLMTMNSYFNIKVGSNRWNASIGEFMDLDNSWAICYSVLGEKFCVYCNISQIVLDSLDAEDNKIRLYVSDTDAYRIGRILKICQYTGKIILPKIYKNNGRYSNISYTVSSSEQSESFDFWGETYSKKILTFDIYDFKGNRLLGADNKPLTWDS